MGYRQYISRVSKSKIDKIRDLNLNELQSSFPLLTDDDYLPIYKLLDNELGVRIYELGKYFDNDVMESMKECNLFLNDDTQDYYDDYYPIILNKNVFLKLAEHYESNVKTHFDLLLTKPDMWGDFEEIPLEPNALTIKDTDEILANSFIMKRVLGDLFQRQRLWKSGLVLDKDKTREMLNNSWLYEYAIFDMLRLHKTADFDNYYYILYGY